MSSTSTADLAAALSGAQNLGRSLGLVEADSWHVGTMGGTYLYLLRRDADGHAVRVIELGATRGKAYDRLHAFSADLLVVVSALRGQA